jgi:uncharacterized protein YecE (DUF72 family)
MNLKGRIRIGISNVVVPGSKKTFPPSFQSGSRLHYYSSIFNTVEINSSFYKIPLRTTFEKWKNDVPGNFQFSLKLSKEVTHTKNLDSDLSSIRSFMEAASGTGNKKGCILIQFPGKITLDYFDKVEQILYELQQYDPSHKWRIAIEFRDTSWYTGETSELLNTYKAAIVLHDFKKAKLFAVMSRADFVYIRFHGPRGDYRESYTAGFLQSKAEAIRNWMDEGKDVYVYFNNTMGSAFENARLLQSLLA